MNGDVVMWSLLACVFVLALFTPAGRSETLAERELEDFDFDGLPGVQHEFKVDVRAGREECFWQNIRKGAEMHVSFEVVRGADRNIDMVVRQPDGRIMDHHQWTPEGTTERVAPMDGIYQFCIDNTFSRFAHKLVFFYFVSYIPEEWEKFAQELEEFDTSAGNITASLGQVDKAVSDMRQFQARSRRHAITDWYIISGNNTYIQYWSILMSFVIVCTSGLQTYFVRNLFSSSNVTPTSKPRA